MINLTPIHTIKALHKVSDTIITAGQPSAKEYRALKEAHIHAVINVLRANPMSEMPDFTHFKEAGFLYYTIQYDLPDSRIAMQNFIELMRALEGKNILIHCAFNWRVSTILDAYYQIINGKINPRAINPDIDLIEITKEYPAIGNFVENIEVGYGIKIVR